VRLVHDQTGRSRGDECAPERRTRQPLGRDVEQPKPPGCELALGIHPFRWRHQRVDGRGGNAASPQHVHLVFHQGNERRDHDAHALEQQRGQLEAQRLSGAGRHHRDEVAALEHRRYRFPLPRAECSQAEVRAEGPVQGDVIHVRGLHGVLQREEPCGGSRQQKSPHCRRNAET
jgi:hypothetical protein